MKIKNLIEIFFVFATCLAMPFIVIGSYFGFIPRSDRGKPVAFCFLIITVLYALFYSYISWQNLKNSDNWKRLTGKDKTIKE
jgi:hypothetical protein